jgi:quinol monooxygenase YgiN
MIGLAAGVFVMIAEFAVVPEKRDDFVAVTAAQVEIVRGFEGNLQFDVLVDPKRPDVVVYVERWKTAGQQEAFYKWWVAKGLTDVLRPYVTAAPNITGYTQAID